jgi:hypothetical protein
VETSRADLDATRAAVFARDLLATASGYLTADVAMQLPFESLGPFKDLVKRFFSTMRWREQDDAELSAVVAPHVAAGWWEHDLGGGITLEHGIKGNDYQLRVSGATGATVSIFDRAFDGPVVPEATPHPRKVKFSFGGDSAPGVWHRRHDPEPPADDRVRRLLGEPDVTDVMVAGDFVTIGLGARSSWEQRLEPLLALVAELFAAEAGRAEAPDRTREELLQEAGHAHVAAGPEELHLLDPDDPAHQVRLQEALQESDWRLRRIAVVLLSESSDVRLRRAALERGLADVSRSVRRTTVDAAADTGAEELRDLLESVLSSDDAWVRWRAVRALGALGSVASRPAIEALAADDEFRVRFEVERVLRGASQ